MRVVLLGLLLATTACTSATADPTAAQDAAEITAAPSEGTAPPNFLEVRPGLYRGGHPDTAGMDYLKHLGVRRVLDLEVADWVEAFPWNITQELDDAQARGITEIRYPMSAFEPAISDTFDQHMNEILALLATATPADPIYVHCKHGQDRAGLVIGLERVFGEKWQAQDAHDEMVRLGFHTLFLGLNEYFENKTGWED
jgi:tyrosine-protein phosphatase SIW14